MTAYTDHQAGKKGAKLERARNERVSSLAAMARPSGFCMVQLKRN